MIFHILTLFPEMVMQGLNTSIIGRAVEKSLITLHAVNIRDYTLDKHGKVDDYPYGGGAGMLMQAQPVYDAHQAVAKGRKIRTIYMTPQGRTFTQKLAMELAQEEELIFLCGHYEGIDERVLEEVVTDYISIGDYVLTGGELPAMVMIDAISRLVSGVLNNDISAHTESFHNDLLEYPQYSRPEEWNGKKVPQVLLSGNHSKITAWRLEQSKERTKQRRPDLYKKYFQKEQLIQRLVKSKRNNIHIIESLSRGNGEILYTRGENILVYDAICQLCMIKMENFTENFQTEASKIEFWKEADKIINLIPANTSLIISSNEFLNEKICSKFSFFVSGEYRQACYTKREALPVKQKEIRLLTEEDIHYVVQHYHVGGEEYIRERIFAKCMYGIMQDRKLVGFAGSHNDGSIGMLFVEENYRRQGFAASLEAYIINRQKDQGYIPYGHIEVTNEISLRLQEKIGLYLSKDKIWWLKKK